MSSNIAFKARTFRLTKSHQYADQLWTSNLSTIASPTTLGRTDSVKAAYLPNGDSAVPTVFGVLSWDAPSGSVDASCTIRVFDTQSNTVIPAASFTSSRADFSGMVATTQGLEIDGAWRIVRDPVTDALAFQRKNADGIYQTKHTISSSGP